MTRARKAPELRAPDVLALAHALRTPLTSLSLAAELLTDERHGPLGGVQRQLARTIVRETAQLRLVLDRALRTEMLGAYAGPVERVALDLAALTTHAIAPLLAQASARKVEIVTALAEEAWVVGDAAKLAWVVASLVGNALRFAPPETEVAVSVSRGRPISLSVGDQGPGVPIRRRHAVFGREAGGTLFLIQEIVHAHGGNIRIAKTAVGASFVVSLPPARSSRGAFP